MAAAPGAPVPGGVEAVAAAGPGAARGVAGVGAGSAGASGAGSRFPEDGADAAAVRSSSPAMAHH
eukprot:152189-Alexandrium_andersonii.AAC.1